MEENIVTIDMNALFALIGYITVLALAVWVGVIVVVSLAKSAWHDVVELYNHITKPAEV